MNRTLRIPFVLLAAVAVSAAQAHFMWATLSPNPRAPSVRFQFAEVPDESVVKEFSGKGPGVRAILADAKPLTLKPLGDTLVGEVPAATTVAGANLDYGVIAREGEFMLVYHAKAAATPEASQASLGLPLEMFAQVGPDGTLWVRVLRDGKPAVGAEVVADLPGVTEEFKGKADAEGRLALPKALGLGATALRAGVTESAAGTFEGKAYKSLHRYTTLTLANLGAAAPKADPAAYAMLEKASNMRASMPNDVASISGTLVVRTPEGKTLRSPFDYSAGSPLAVEADGWPRAETIAAAELVTSMLEHRGGGDFARGDGRNPMTFGEDTPQGRRIFLHDRMNSSYLVKGDEITEVDRVMGTTRLVLTIHENLRTPSGKTLPQRFDGKLYDLKGTLLKTYSWYDEFQNVEGVWLPKLRRVTTTEKGKSTTRETRFEGLKLAWRETEG